MPFGSAARVVPLTRLYAVLAAGNAHMRLRGSVARTGAGGSEEEAGFVDAMDTYDEEPGIADHDTYYYFPKGQAARNLDDPTDKELEYPTDEELKAMADWIQKMQGQMRIVNERATVQILDLFAELNRTYPIRVGPFWTLRMAMLTEAIPTIDTDRIERYFRLTDKDYAITGGMPSKIYDSPYDNDAALELGEEKMVQVREWIKANRCQWPSAQKRALVAKGWGWNADDQTLFKNYTADWMNKVKTQENRALGGKAKGGDTQGVQLEFDRRFREGVDEILRENLYADEKLKATDAAFRSPALGTIRNKGSLPYLRHLRRHEPQKASSVVDELFRFECMRI